MDSTLITIECIDELADFAGKKPEVSAVTEAAMRGDIDYRESLRQRLALLAGLDARVLARVFGERLLLSPGARELLEAAQNAGLRTAILSGGFTYFTERLRIELGFDFATSNELEISGGKLTGRVAGDIVDAAAKAHHLARLTDELGLRKAQVIAIGDGANDLLMMAEAGTFGGLPRQAGNPRQGRCRDQFRRARRAAQPVRLNQPAGTTPARVVQPAQAAT